MEQVLSFLRTHLADINAMLQMKQTKMEMYQTAINELTAEKDKIEKTLSSIESLEINIKVDEK